MNIREQIFQLAAQHCDAQNHSRERAVLGWNFSKEGLMAFVEELRSLPTDEELDRKRWESHISMERHEQHARLLEFGLPVYGAGEQAAQEQ